MKRAIILAVVVMSVAVTAFAQTRSGVTAGQKGAQQDVLTLKGYLIDGLNASTKNPEQLEEFVKTYSKSDILPPKNAEKGYVILVNRRIYAFDGDSCVKVNKFLQKPDSKLQVVVEAKPVGDKDVVSLVSIRNAED